MVWWAMRVCMLQYIEQSYGNRMGQKNWQQQQHHSTAFDRSSQWLSECHIINANEPNSKNEDEDEDESSRVY